MYIKHRSWGVVATCLFVSAGVFLLPLFGPKGIDSSVLFPLGLAVVFGALGIWVARLNRGEGYQYKNVKVDKSLSYTFTLTDSSGKEEKVEDFSQIEKALDYLEQTKKGNVSVQIEPAMGTFCNVECCYKDGQFYTYYLQERPDGKGYWYSMTTDGVFEAKGTLRNFYIKHKKFDFYLMNFMATGEEI